MNYQLNSSIISKDDFSIKWLIWFGICLFPLSIEQNGVGMSANYLFVLTPLAHLLSGKRLIKLPYIFKLYLLICTVIFVIALTYQINFYEHTVRRVASYMIFVSVLTLPTVNFTEKMTYSFFLGVIGISLIISMTAIIGLITYGELNPAELKGEIGTQRIGFVYIFGFWILTWIINKRQYDVLQKMLLISLIIIILLGIILTFSRAAYLSFVSSLLFYYYAKIRKTKISIKNFFNLLISFLFVVSGFFTLGLIYPELYKFLDQRFFQIFQDGNLSTTLSDSETSEGYRVTTWMEIFEFVLRNPVTGSGFLGSWVYLPDQGSSHSEYIDKFTRLGMFGFIVYVILLKKIYSFLLEKHLYLFAAFGGGLTYGFFHETFSLSQGAVIFSFILVLYVKYCNYKSLK
jgi:O-antigen ligase